MGRKVASRVVTTSKVLRAPDAGAIESLRAIDHAVLAVTGHEAIPEATWRALEREPADCVLALSPDGRVGAVALPSDSFTPAYRAVAVAARPATPAAAIVE